MISFECVIFSRDKLLAIFNFLDFNFQSSDSTLILRPPYQYSLTAFWSTDAGTSLAYLSLAYLLPIVKSLLRDKYNMAEVEELADC